MGDPRVLPDGQSLPPPCGDAPLGKLSRGIKAVNGRYAAGVQQAAQEAGALLGGSISIGPRPEGEPSAGALTQPSGARRKTASVSSGLWADRQEIAPIATKGFSGEVGCAPSKPEDKGASLLDRIPTIYPRAECRVRWFRRKWITASPYGPSLENIE
jgi:hypothetical protein